ncbi:MAG TPA: HdeD family acid-resistance protein [Steroidobacteraceae bacterium]|nr:HdeD family acid-resistance protein [Steroidobacteraceae bacterium]
MSTPHSTRPGEPGRPGASAAGEQGPAAPQQTGSSPPGGPATGYRAGPEADRAGFGPDVASSVWPAFLAAAFGAIAVGVVLLVWPKATLTIVAVLIGIALIVAGLLRLIDGFTAHDASGGKRVAYVLIGLLAIIVGLYCIRHYNLVIGALAVIVGLFWVIHGIADIAIGLFGGPFPGRWLTVAAGILSLFAGLIVLFWPAITVIVLVRVIGIWLLVYGLLMAIMAFSLRRHGEVAAEPGQLTSA